MDVPNCPKDFKKEYYLHRLIRYVPIFTYHLTVYHLFIRTYVCTYLYLRFFFVLIYILILPYYDRTVRSIMGVHLWKKAPSPWRINSPGFHRRRKMLKKVSYNVKFMSVLCDIVINFLPFSDLKKIQN